ncbi:MAG: transporter [Desulfobacterales bacterium]|nr:MAG: transporter [Desulfobacterales bacterium]
MLNQRKEKLALITTILVFFLLSVTTGYCGTQKLKLGFVTAANEKDPYYITAKKFSELVQEYTDGRYEIDLFGGGQLGNESEMIKNLTMGTMDAGVITNAPVGSFVNAFMVLDLPFIFPSGEVAHTVLDGSAGTFLLKKLSRLQITGLAFSEGGFRHMINNTKPVKIPEDLKNVKYRVMKTPIYIGMFKSFGANAVPMPWGEVFSAVQQKVVDGLEIPIPVIYANKFYEVTKYLSLTGHTYSPLIIMVSNNTWKKLSLSDRQAFTKAAKEAAVYERAEIAKIVKNFIEDLKKEGMLVNEISNKKPFQSLVGPMYKDFENKIGADVIKKVLSARNDAQK